MEVNEQTICTDNLPATFEQLETDCSNVAIKPQMKGQTNEMENLVQGFLWHL